MMTEVQERSCAQLNGLLKNMLDDADDTLFSMAEKAESERSQQIYFAAMRDLRVRRRHLEREFGERMTGAFEAFQEGRDHDAPTCPDTLASGELKLVEEEEMEEQVASYNMAAKAERRNGEALYLLGRRLESITGRQNLDRVIHPLHPATVVEAFRHALDDIEGLIIDVRLVILKLFERGVMDRLEELYSAINDFLIAEGVLPRIVLTAPRQPILNPVAGTVPASPEPPGGEAAGYAHPGGPANATGSPGVAIPSAGLPAGGTIQVAGFPVPQGAGVVGALTHLQSGVAQGRLEMEGQPLHLGQQVLHLLQEVKGLQGGGADESDRSVIHLVSLIFDFILEDESVPDAVKAVLAKLQIPYLKLGLMDETFLASRNHPARQLLNEMAHAAIGIDAPEAIRQDPLFHRIEEVVNAILTGFDNDVSLFARLLGEFAEFREQQEQRNRKFEERTRKTIEGRERVLVAKMRAEAWIDQWTARPDTPPFIARFLRDHWQPAMLVTMQRHGEQSPEWANLVNTVNHLIWSLQPKEDAEQTRRLVKILPGLLTNLRIGMDLASMHPRSIQEFFHELAERHLRAVNGRIDEQWLRESAKKAGEKGFSSPSRAPELPEQEEVTCSPPLLEEVVEPPARPAPSMPVEGAATPSRDRQRSASSAELGCGRWFELDLSEGSRRAKLSWRSPVTGSCLFVDLKGSKVATLRAEELDELLRQGKIRPLEAAPLFDRAVRAAFERERTEREPPI